MVNDVFGDINKEVMNEALLVIEESNDNDNEQFLKNYEELLPDFDDMSLTSVMDQDENIDLSFGHDFYLTDRESSNENIDLLGDMDELTYFSD